MTRLVIFDLDGTLVDAYRAVEASLNFVVTRLGYARVPAGMVKRSVGWGEANLVSRFVLPEQLERALAMYRRHHKQSLLDGVKALPGARTVLKTLRRRAYPMAIASNRPSETTRIILRQLDWEGYFDTVLCADQAARPKPYPDLLRDILRRHRLKARDAVYVGDMPIDVQAGRRARVRTAAVLTGSGDAGDIRRERPFWVLKRVDELVMILNKEEEAALRG